MAMVLSSRTFVYFLAYYQGKTMEVMMKTENINRLIAHVEGLKEQIPNWGRNHCLSGMILKLQGLQGQDSFGKVTIEVVRDFTGSDRDSAETLSYRWNYDEGIEDRGLDEQKENIIHALTTLRDNGKAEWLW